MRTMKCWKWSRSDHKTYNDTLWGEGVEHSVSEWTGKLCTAGVIHAYQDPWLAVLMAPADGYDYEGSILWEAEAGGRLVIKSDMIGCETLRTIRQVEPPVITAEQRVEIAVRCMMAVSPKRRKWAETWREWAERWLSGEDRSYKSARATADAIHYAARRGAADAGAARAAARAAANYAADAATGVGHSATHAAIHATYTAITDHKLNIIAIIRQVCCG